MGVVMKRALWALALLLPGCVGLDVPSANKPNFVLNAQGPTNVGVSEPDGWSLIAAFSNSYNLAQCRFDLIQDAGAADLHFQYYVVNSAGDTEAKAMKCADQANVDKAEVAQKMYEDGMAVADAVCRSYFRRLGNQNQDLDYYSMVSNNLGGFVAAVLGAAESSAKSVAITSASFAAITAGFETFDEAYHFNPDVKSVEQMVFRAKSAFITEYGRVTTFKEATTGVEGYQSICQTSNIQRLVNEAVSRADLSAAPRTARDRLIPESISNVETGKLSGILGTANRVSSGAIAWVTALSRGRVRTPADRQKLDALLNAEGITLDNTKLANFDQWLDNLRIAEPRAYTALLQRADALDPQNLPDIGSAPAEQTQALEDAARDEEENKSAPEVFVQ